MWFNNPRDKEVNRRSEVLKILNGYENIDRNMSFSNKKGNKTRRHEITLLKEQNRLDIGKSSFSHRTIH